MHFFYLDEFGDTGRNLNDPNQPILVLGGINLRDEGWNQTQKKYNKIITDFFNNQIPDNFELHADDLLSPTGEGSFSGYSLEARKKLAVDVLKLLRTRKHGVQYIAIDKQKVSQNNVGLTLEFNPKRPYMLAFDYMLTYIDFIVKNNLGRSARGFIIVDRKEQYHDAIEKNMRLRRFSGTQAHKIKWIVEIGYPVDSKKNSMIQIADLVIYCIRRFIELENGYRDNWNDETKNYYATCFNLIDSRVARKNIIERQGRSLNLLNGFLNAVKAAPSRQWKRRYHIQNL